MPNPFYNPKPNLYNQFMNSNNPMQLFENIAMQNPQLNSVLNMLKTNNPQQVFITLCNQRGIDPNSFIKNITK